MLADLLRNEDCAEVDTHRPKSIVYFVLENRKSLLAAFDDMQRTLNRQQTFGGLDRFQAQALEMIASPTVRDAFDLTHKKPETLARYRHKACKYPHHTAKQYMYDWNSKPFLMAWRLVEAGVRVVTLHTTERDHHSSPTGDVFFALECLMPMLDMSITALVADLHDRGLWDNVLVVVLGQFGRTPKINNNVGRDHWSDACSVMLTGGGLKTGQALGTSNARVQIPQARPIHYNDVLATVYRQLGVETDRVFMHEGRPVPILHQGTPLPELI